MKRRQWLQAGTLVLLLTRRMSVQGDAELDFTPAPRSAASEPAVEPGPDEGPVMVTLQYQIDPARAEAFAEVMQRTRRARLRQGALSWGLFRDVSVPGRYVEYFVDGAAPLRGRGAARKALHAAVKRRPPHGAESRP